MSAIFNTDGVPSYSSSGTKLWPIFLALHELPPAVRFAKGNMILAGLWQGKGNPPFFQYMAEFGEEMFRLFTRGIVISPPDVLGKSVPVRLGMFLGIMDLQAKSYVLNMSHHNGQNGCITCEEPGQAVKHGKGTARCYLYRSVEQSFPERQSDDLKQTIGPNPPPPPSAKSNQRHLWPFWVGFHAVVQFGFRHGARLHAWPIAWSAQNSPQKGVFPEQ